MYIIFKQLHELTEKIKKCVGLEWLITPWSEIIFTLI